MARAGRNEGTGDHPTARRTSEQRSGVFYRRVERPCSEGAGGLGEWGLSGSCRPDACMWRRVAAPPSPMSTSGREIERTARRPALQHSATFALPSLSICARTTTLSGKGRCESPRSKGSPRRGSDVLPRVQRGSSVRDLRGFSTAGKARTPLTMSDGTGLSEALGLAGLRLLAVCETEAEAAIDSETTRCTRRETRSQRQCDGRLTAPM
jgi:hypothetical protein